MKKPRLEIVEPLTCTKSPTPGYRLPFPRSHDVIIVQGYGGSHGHFAYQRGSNFVYDDTFSLDFGLPLRTPVLASRSGKVIVAHDNSTEFYIGLDPKIGMHYIPNMVVIEGDDGTKTLYAHLEKGSAQVKQGDKVESGQRIARTGLSGWTGDIPNLHFSAFKYTDQHNRITFPVTFEDFSGELWHSRLHHAES